MPTVGKWRKRFIHNGLVGLYDEHRPGCPRTHDDEKVANLLQTVLESAPTQGTHWSVRSAARATGISKSAVQRYFRVFGIQPHNTPTYSSWLNQVERWFGHISEKAIRRGSFRSTKELVAKIEDFVANYNEYARPFIWTATADSILKKIENICKLINGTAH